MSTTRNHRQKSISRHQLIASGLTLSMLLTPASWANVVGSDTQNFNPTTNGLDFVTVQSSETLEPGVFNLGLFFNYATNTLPYFERDTAPGQRVQFNDSILSADFNAGYGLLPNWELGLSLPQMLDQKVVGDDFHGQFSSNGSTEIRLNTKYRLWGDTSQGIAAIGTASFNRIKDNPFVGANAGPTYTLELAGDKTINEFALGANLGYRIRQPGDKVSSTAPIDPLKNQIIASIAGSYHIAAIDTKIIAEIFGSAPQSKENINSDRVNTSAEGLLGVKHDFNHSLAGHFGMGTELQHGISSPDFRVYAGVNYALGTRPRPEATADPVLKPALTLSESEPTAPFAGPVQNEETIRVASEVFFEFDSDQPIVDAQNNAIEQLAAHLNKGNGFKRLIIEGHTDSVGNRAYNLDLSRRRSANIRKILVERYKIPAAKVQAVGYGPDRPISDNGNFQGRQKNRRVEFQIFR